MAYSSTELVADYGYPIILPNWLLSWSTIQKLYQLLSNRKPLEDCQLISSKSVCLPLAADVGPAHNRYDSPAEFGKTHGLAGR
jgi:hypothetical protein